MRAWFHYLLIILIALLPLQGGAIAAMPTGAAMPMAHHAHMAAQAADMAVPMAECCDDGDALVQVGNAHAKCNTNANCCVGAVAPPVAMGGLATTLFSLRASSLREPAMTGFIPPTLERPPRSC